MVHRMIAAGLLIAVCALGASAQSKGGSAPPAMKRPGPGPQRARLAFLVGEFETSTRVMSGRPGTPPALGSGTSSIRWGLDSMFLFIDEQSVNTMLGNYKGFGILGYEPSSSQYTLTMCNNFGDRPEYRGAFSADTLVMTAKIPFPGGAFDQKLLWFAEANTVHLQVFNDLGKGLVQVVDQTARPR